MCSIIETQYLSVFILPIVANAIFKNSLCCSCHLRTPVPLRRWFDPSPPAVLKVVTCWLQKPKVRTTKAPTAGLVKVKMELLLQSKSGLGCCCWVKVAAMATAATSIIPGKVTRGHTLLILVSTQRESKNCGDNRNNKMR